MKTIAKNAAILFLVLATLFALCSCNRPEDGTTTSQTETPSTTNQAPIEAKKGSTVLGAEVLEFTLLEDDTYAVSAGDDFYSYTDIHLVIPAEYNGKPVSRISDSGFPCIIFREYEVEIPGLGMTTRPFAEYYDDILISIEIPSSVTSIGCDLFSACKSLQGIYYDGTQKQWHSMADTDFSPNRWDLNLLSENYTIHCSDGDIVVNAE